MSISISEFSKIWEGGGNIKGISIRPADKKYVPSTNEGTFFSHGSSVQENDECDTAVWEWVGFDRVCALL